MTAPPLHADPQAAPSVQSATPLPRWADAVKQAQQIARAALADQDLPGLSIAVGVSSGEGSEPAIVWAEGFGWANVEQRVPVAPGTRFRIGHTSKALTSAAAGLLVEQRRLRLDEEIQTYVPQFPRKPWPVTVRQLMAHTAGIRHYRDTEWGDRPSGHCERASEGLEIFAGDPLLFEPETQYKYSTFGWILVSAALEAAAGEPFFTVMRRQVFEPLGMAGTIADSTSTPVTDLTTFYESAVITNNRQPAPTVDYTCFAGASGFLSTPSDLVRFGMAMNAGRFLQRDTVSMLQTTQLLSSGAETAYGLGWMLENLTLAGRPARAAGHASRTPVGGSTSFLTFPDRGLVVAVTTNIGFADTKQVAVRVADVFAQRLNRPAGQ